MSLLRRRFTKNYFFGSTFKRHMTKRKRETDVSTFDMTINEGHNDYKLESSEVLPRLQKLAKKWVCQREVGSENGTKHWQIRLRTWRPMRLSAFVALCTDEGIKGHCSVTSNAAHKSKTFSYVMKADTRDPDHPEVHTDENYEPPPVRLSHIEAFESYTLWPWQQQVMDEHKTYDPRQVDVIVDTKGNMGKNDLQDYLQFLGGAWKVPNFTEQTDMIEFVFSFPERPCYLVNMPKAQNKKKLAGFYAGIETLKDGYLYDKRYKGRMKQIEKPRVFVFTNQIPEVSLLSADRWRIWYLRPSTKALEDVTDSFVLPTTETSAEEQFDIILEARASLKRPKFR